jgi:hypothetical protein
MNYPVGSIWRLYGPEGSDAPGEAVALIRVVGPPQPHQDWVGDVAILRRCEAVMAAGQKPSGLHIEFVGEDMLRWCHVEPAGEAEWMIAVLAEVWDPPLKEGDTPGS